MEVTGTAVGIASLGIQVCQGLLSYYADWRDYNANISITYNAIIDLSKTLTLLKSSLENEELDAERAERVRTCLVGCVDALRELEKERHELRKHGSPDGMRQKMRSGWQRLWYPLKKETLEELKANVIGVQERLKLALHALQLETGLESKKLLVGLRRQTTAQDAFLAQVSAQNQRILNVQQSDEYRKIVAWIAAPDPWTNHESARQKHEDQTGRWLIQSDPYLRWKSGEDRHLWMYGKAGCGKTILCSTAVEDIKRHCGHDPDTVYATFYFTFSDDHKQSESDLLRSLVTQLGWKEPGLSMLRQAYERPQRSVPGPDELERIFLASIKSWRKVFLLVDAIDECPEDHEVRESVLDRVEGLIHGASNLRIFATSRELPTISEPMAALGFERLRIETSAVDGDIRIYVANQLSRDRSFRKFGLGTLDLIEIILRRDRMGSPKYVKHALDVLPKTFDDTYARILNGIEDMYYQHAFTLLQWLTYARSPLTLGELVEAAIVDPVEESWIDIGNRGDLEDSLNILFGLVIIEGTQTAKVRSTPGTESFVSDLSSIESNYAGETLQRRHLSSNTKVRLAHFSIKEYLESKRILESPAHRFHVEKAKGHRFLTWSCLTYMEYYIASNEKASTKRDLETFPLLGYAARSWFRHGSMQQGDEADREISFLKVKSKRYDWLLVHDPDTPWHIPFDGPRSLCSATYYASRLGLRVVVNTLPRSVKEVNVQGGRYGNALQAASVEGHISTVHLLLDKYADINAQGGEYGNALQAALAGGHGDVVQLLLDKGADVKAQGGWFGYALQAASYRGEIEAVQLLLDNGADIDAEGGWYGNALQAASAEAHVGVAQLLLDNGADVNAQGGGFGSALQAAAFRGHLEMVQILLDNGADIKLGVGFHGNALYAASEGGHVRVARLLLDYGVTVNAQGGQLTYALNAASDEGHTEVVRLLLGRGADVNAHGGFFGDALKTASFRGYADVVQLLLDNGADVNVQGGLFATALQAASSQAVLGAGHLEVAQLLRASGASNPSADV